MSGAVDQAKDAVSTVQRSFPYRTYQRYGNAAGNVLAGGIAYFAFFSIFPALIAALTIVGFLMQGVPEVRDWVVRNLVSGSTPTSRTCARGAAPGGGARANGIYIDDYLTGSALTWPSSSPS